MKKETIVKDRRQFKRHEMLIKLRYFDPKIKKWGETLSKNISKTGLRFPVKSKLDCGTTLDLKIEDPNTGKFITSKGKIIWANKENEIGVSLVKKRLY